MSIPSWMLCGEDGPSGGFALVTAHVKGKDSQPFYTDIRYNDKIRYNDNLNGAIPWLKMGQIIRDIQEYCI